MEERPLVFGTEEEVNNLTALELITNLSLIIKNNLDAIFKVSN